MKLQPPNSAPMELKSNNKMAIVRSIFIWDKNWSGGWYKVALYLWIVRDSKIRSTHVSLNDHTYSGHQREERRYKVSMSSQAITRLIPASLGIMHWSTGDADQLIEWHLSDFCKAQYVPFSFSAIPPFCLFSILNPFSLFRLSAFPPFIITIEAGQYSIQLHPDRNIHVRSENLFSHAHGVTWGFLWLFR